MKVKQHLVVILAALALAAVSDPIFAQEARTTKLREAEVGVVTAHSEGLHGYIGFSHERPPPQPAYNAGMGFYAAVWPLVDQPLADFQIGLPSSWMGRRGTVKRRSCGRRATPLPAWRRC